MSEQILTEFTGRTNEGTEQSKNSKDVNGVDLESKTETNAEEEVDLDSLQKGLAKAMVLQWKSDNPDQSLDDIILSATKGTGSYDDVLLEKGIDKTLYDQWRYVKYKLSMPKLVRAKKPIEINLPERRARQLLALKMKKELETESESKPSPEATTMNSEFVSSEAKSSEVLKIEQKVENGQKHVAVDGSLVSKPVQDKIANETNSETNRKSYTNVKSDVKTLSESVKVGEGLKKESDRSRESETVSTTASPLNTNEVNGTSTPQIQTEDTKDSLARIKRLLEQNKRVESYPEITTNKFPTLEGLSLNKEAQNPPLVPQDIDQKNTQERSKVVPDNQIMEKEVVTSVSDEKVDKDVQNDSEEIPQTKEAIPQGTTKNLLQRWQNQQPESTQKKKKLIVVVEDDGNGTAAEDGLEKPNIVKAVEVPEHLIEKGSTKQLMNQLLSSVQADSSTKVCANENSNDSGADSTGQGKIEVEKGYTKQMLDRWKSQDVTTNVSTSRRRVEIREEDGAVVENEPQVSETVCEESSPAPSVFVQEGITKALLDRWEEKQSEVFKVERSQIIISGSDGKVVENEPMERSDVIKSGTIEETTIEKGLTKQLLNQWSNKPNYKVQNSKHLVVISVEDGKVAENEPIQRDDVSREEFDVDPLQVVQKGTTKALLSQWTNQKTCDPSSSRKEFIISQDAGHIAENEPTVREDVVRESDSQTKVEVVEKGTTKNLMKQWSEDKVDGKQEKEDVSQISDTMKGFTKKRLNQWAEKSSEKFVSNRRSIVLEEDSGHIAENEPVVRDDVIRSDNISSKEETIQKGFAKSLTSQWNTGAISSAYKKEPLEKRISVSEDAGYIAENDPSPRKDDVFREDNQNEESQMPLKGQTSLMKQQFIPKNDILCAKKEPIKMFSDSQVEKPVAENQPTKRDDVFREEDFSEEILHKKGFAKSMVGFWNKPQTRGDVKNKQAIIELADGPTVFENTPQPSKLTHMKPASESGVFENQPVSRQDVVREADCETETIPAGVARNVRKMWSQKENQCVPPKQSKAPEPVRFTPPREKTPPQITREEFKSTRTVTLKSNKSN